MRARRRSVSSVEKPQSTRTRVAPASTTSPFPWLPLPSDAKRTAGPTRSAAAAPGSFQLVVQEREDLLRGAGRVRGTVLAEHLHLALVGAAVLDGDLVLRCLRRLGRAPERELGEEAVILLLVAGGIHVADEVDALRPVAILDREPDAIEREPDPPPGAIERLVDVQDARRAVRSRNELRAVRPHPARRRELRFRLRLRHADLDHEAPQELGLELGIGWAWLPDGRRVS